MIDRRRLMFASVAGILAPLGVVLAQPAPDERRDEGPPNHGHEEAERPRMPPPRHEDRPPPPGPEAQYHWRDGHWDWDGRQWVWVRGTWYR